MEEKLKHFLQEISKIFLQQGTRSTSMDDIARNLGISKKTLYQYFKDKNDLVLQVVSFQMEQTNCYFKDLMKKEGNAIDILLEVGQFLVSTFGRMHSSISYDLKKYYPEASKLMEEHRQSHVLENIERNLLRGIKEGIYRQDINTKIIAYFYLLRIDHLFSYDVKEDILQDYPMEGLLKELFNYHIRGIANDKGIAYLKNKLLEN